MHGNRARLKTLNSVYRRTTTYSNTWKRSSMSSQFPPARRKLFALINDDRPPKRGEVRDEFQGPDRQGSRR